MSDDGFDCFDFGTELGGAADFGTLGGGTAGSGSRNGFSRRA
jgi:hypothetical protein